MREAREMHSQQLDYLAIFGQEILEEAQNQRVATDVFQACM
jgi:hypothetical protein